ncbi:TPM domain-containing protein [Methyloversatilis thermotolerans]|uniref:TPM domain-containing protein n=1 Tax=Methyloversatilis thermotolerans TaxID=1346290 RepID=UPI000362866F|nr:TPM domain-containing protein [Methyloversatilis thermotolerans]
MIGRLLKHLCALPFMTARALPAHVLAELEAAIASSERHHAGELRLVVEHALHPLAIIRGQSGRDRAVDLFSSLRIWDTEHNSGVLIYLLMADHDIEIVVDRGVRARVPDARWAQLCRELEVALRERRFHEGLLQAVAAVTAELSAHFPADDAKHNELPDRVLSI